MVSDDIREMLNEAKEFKDVTYRYLEYKSGVSANTIYRYLSGKGQMGIDNVEALAESLGYRLLLVNGEE